MLPSSASAAVAKGGHDDARCARRTGILPPDGDVEIGAELGPDPIQQQQRRRPQHLRQIDRHAVRVGHRVHQRARQVHQPAAPQHAIGEFEDVQADRVGAGRLVVADKPLGLQRAQDVVGGAAMQPRGARDLARIQRPLRGVQRAQHFGRRDDRADRFARIAPAAIGRTALFASGTGCLRSKLSLLDRAGYRTLCLRSVHIAPIRQIDPCRTG